MFDKTTNRHRGECMWSATSSFIVFFALAVWKVRKLSFYVLSPWDNTKQFQSCMILGVPSVQQWERVKLINKLVRCLECLNAGWCVCVCVFDDAGVSVSERCLKGVKIVRWWVLCSQITASDKAQEKHWLYRYLSSAPYLRCEDVSLSKQRTFQRQVSTLTTKQCLSQAHRPNLTTREHMHSLGCHYLETSAAAIGIESSSQCIKGTFWKLPAWMVHARVFVSRWQQMTGSSAGNSSRRFSVTPVESLVGRVGIRRSHWTGVSAALL